MIAGIAVASYSRHVIYNIKYEKGRTSNKGAPPFFKPLKLRSRAFQRYMTCLLSRARGAGSPYRAKYGLSYTVGKLSTSTFQIGAHCALIGEFTVFAGMSKGVHSGWVVTSGLSASNSNSILCRIL